MKRTIFSLLVSTILFSSSAMSSSDPLIKMAAQKEKQLSNLINSNPVVDVTNESELKQALSMYDKLHWGVRLPIKDLSIVENQDGERLLIDSTARLIIRGNFQLFDAWNKRVVKDKDTVKKMWLTPLSIFNINPGDLAVYKYGLKKEKADLTVLVDPNGKFNSKLFTDMELLADKYAFDILMVPLTGDTSIMDSISLWCHKDQESSLEHLMQGASIKPNMNLIATCDKKPLMMNIALAGLLHVDALPHLVRSDGLNKSGTPENLQDFMHKDTSNIAEVAIK